MLVGCGGESCSARLVDMDGMPGGGLVGVE